MSQWYLTTPVGRRGPFSRDELRRMRAAFEIPPAAIVCDDAGAEIAIEELLPEFKTGPLDRRPGPPPRSIHPPLLYRLGINPWDAIRALLPPLPLSRFHFRFSLRTLLLCFLFLGPPLGIVSNDLASRRRQAQIVQPWIDAGGSVGWQWYRWRFWKRDVISLYVPSAGLSGPVCRNLDQLPELTYLRFNAGGCSREQFAEICRARSISNLSISRTFIDDDLAPIADLRNLKRLLLENSDAHRTVRRLRGHPRLESLLVYGRCCSEQMANDVATMPRLTEFYGSFFAEKKSTAYEEYSQILPTERNVKAPEPREFYNVAFVGANARRKVVDSLLPAMPRESAETMFDVLVQPKADVFITTPLDNDLNVLSRVLWMADRAYVVVDAAEGITEDVRNHCLIARVMKTPDRFLLITGGGKVSAERRHETIAECQAAAADLAVSGVILEGADPVDWLSRNIELRPPTGHLLFGAPRIVKLIVQTNEPTPPPRRGPDENHIIKYSLLAHGFALGSISYDFEKGRPAITYTENFQPDEEVVLLRDGKILGLGVLK